MYPSAYEYIPRNGIATTFQIIEAANTVFGMSVDLGAFLAFYAAATSGDGLRLSIGGTDSRVGLPLLGKPHGLSGSHNKFELDVSPTRGDLYQYGNADKIVPEQFKALYALQLNESEANSNYNLKILTEYRAFRFQQSINDNPYFFNDIVTGVVVQAAPYAFQFRLMSNHSAEFPEGRLSKDVLKSFFGVSGNYPDFSFVHGHERIPDNWYRRPIDYTLPEYLLDLIDAARKYPQFLSVGGNLGRTNSFTGISLANLTGGLYDASSLLKPSTLVCFVREMVLMQVPDLLLGLGPLQTLLGVLNGLVPKDVTCPQLANVDPENLLSQFPGYSNLSAER